MTTTNQTQQTLCPCVVDTGKGYVIYENGFDAGQHIVYGIQRNGVNSKTLPSGIEGTNYTMWGKPWYPSLNSVQTL